MKRSVPAAEKAQFSNALAIVGMACRLPGGNETPDDYWQFLLDRKSGIREVPEDRWNVDNFYNENPDGIATATTKWAGFLDDIRGFDAKFFGISPREAAAMDPQQRLLLQCTYEALQDTQRPASDYAKGKTGVFVGISQSDYRTIQELRPTNPENFAGTGYALCINANRISHRLNLKGPSYAVDTACSSSLVALNQAVQNLASGACDVAVVAGVNVLAHPSSFIAFSRAGMLSSTGQISTFDNRANGFVRGEAAGVVVLKPYHKALEDGDRIHALIHASACNQDGYTSTITAPAQDSQIAMLEDLFTQSGVAKESIGYVEAHGTGTPVGDPIEAGAIGTVIGQHNAERPVWIGSGKANVGHAEAAAGISGLIKAVLAVRNGMVPPNVNFDKPNPNIPFDALNLKVPTEAQSFPEADGLRYAVVNSFGFGGTNASALISSVPEQAAVPVVAAPRKGAEDFPYFFPLSGPSQEAILANAADLLALLKDEGSALAQLSLAELSAALGKDRAHLTYRTMLLARTRDELLEALALLVENDEEKLSEAKTIVTGQARTETSLCFVFAGQGSQWWAMGRQFMEHSPVFRDAVEAYDAHFKKVAGWSLVDELLADEAASRIDDTAVTQPALFAIQAGLGALWESFGIKPDMVVGHSIGESAASYIAGGLTLEGAASFLSKRGVVRDQLGQKGAMAAVGLAPEDIAPLLPPKINVAAVNGPGSTTISGDYDTLHAFVEEFQETQPDTFIRILKVDTAWHSYQLEAGEEWFRREVKEVSWRVPHIPFISTVTGKPETKFDLEYAWLNLRRPVMFQQGIETALTLGATTFVELGPHSTLMGPTKSTALEAGAKVDVFQSLSRKEADFDIFARTAAQLFVSGYALDWDALTGGAEAPVALPRNHWMQESLWQDSEESRRQLYGARQHPFLGRKSADAGNAWWMELNTKAWPFLKDHRMQSETLFPGAGYLETLVALGVELYGDKPLELSDTILHEALFLEEDQDMLLSLAWSPDRKRAKLFSRPRDSRDDWVLRSEGKLRATDVPAPADRPFDPATTALEEVDVAHVYDVDASQGFVNYGPAFQVIEQIWVGEHEAVARIKAPAAIAGQTDIFYIHPSLMDGCLQMCDPRISRSSIRTPRKAGDPAYLPVGARRLRFYGRLPDEVMAHAHRAENPVTGEIEAHFIVTDMAGRVLFQAEGLMTQALPTKAATEDSGEIAPNFVEQGLSEIRDEPALVEEALGTWLVLADTGADVAPLVAEMTALGATPAVLTRAELGDELVQAVEDQFGEALEQAQVKGILFAAALGAADASAEAASADLYAQIERNVMDLITIGDLMDFHRTNEVALPRIAVLTSGAYPDPVSGETGPAGLTQTPVSALGRVLATETPEYHVRMFDHDGSDSAQLALRLLSDTPETETVIREGKTYGARLFARDTADFEPKLVEVPASDESVNFHATMRAPGVIDDLGLWELPLEELADDEVRVRVSAVGMNFRDVMAVTGLLPEEAEPDPAWQHLGLEFGAVVHAVGKNVTGLKPGDRVMGMGRRCLQRFMDVNPRALTVLPEHISLEEAATIPSAFATAHYALNRVGRMRKGEKVFIHVATGGVGMAGIQLCQDAGTEIFATAGSPAKRELLAELGANHIMDSRSLKFADDVERITSGRGVDVLLNSLPGEYITKGLDIVAPYGRYLEIGKVDVYADSAIGMKALRKNVSFSCLDLAAMGQERPELLAELMQEVVEMFAERRLKPLPVTSFPISQIGDAVRYMSQARHVGKVVVSLEEPSFKIRRDISRPVALSADASYLITGGTKGFGLTIADWMSRAGAGKLVLTSRGGTFLKEDMDRVKAMQARGTLVEALALDVTSEAEMEAFIGAATADARHPLRGVVHGAAVIKDGFLNQLTPEVITEVLRPKVLGGWILHRAFEKAGVQPDFLIGFSSIAEVIGSGGQGNYVAANAFLTALARYRDSLGLNGTAINWGAMAESGFVARSDGMASYLESVGLHGLSDEETDMGMEIAVSRDLAGFCYSKADWPQIARANTALGGSPRMAPLLQKDGGGGGEVRARLMALTGDELRAEAIEFLKDEVANVLKIDKATIQSDRPMSELGLDSLSSFELKMRVETALDFTMPVSRFLAAPSIDEFATILEEEIAAMVEAEANAANAEEAGAEGEEAGEDTRRGVLGSDRQMGLLRASLAPMSSDAGRLSLFHVVTAPIATDLAAASGAMAALADRHALLKLRPEGTGEALALQLDGAPQVLETLPGVPDVAAGQLVLLGVDAGKVTLMLHQAVGDLASAELLLAELETLLSGGTLAPACPAAAVTEALAAARYDEDSAEGQNDRAFWWYAMRAGAAQLPFDRRARALLPVGLGRDRGASVVSRIPLATPQSEPALLLGFARALRGATGSTGNVLVTRIEATRQHLPEGAAVGPFEVDQPVLVECDLPETLALARLTRTLAAAPGHSRFGSTTAARVFGKQIRGWNGHPFQVAVTRGTGASSSAVAGYDLVLEIGEGELRLVRDADVVTEAQAEAIARALTPATVPAA
ncbi:MAG: SDR family NAD(P)-dependent oxidoreductase [Rhodobacteraceae bacterium]|nr:SDR family NAD(P)-dependent oxidoreductase [Paracoccaceae bacterium]